MIDFEIPTAFLSVLTIITLWQTNRDLLSPGVWHYCHFTEEITGKYNGHQLTDTRGRLHSSKTSNRNKRCEVHDTAHGSQSRQHLDNFYLASTGPLHYVHYKYPAMCSVYISPVCWRLLGGSLEEFSVAHSLASPSLMRSMFTQTSSSSFVLSTKSTCKGSIFTTSFGCLNKNPKLMYDNRF